MSKKPDIQYYTMDLKKALNLMIDADRSMRLYATSVKMLVEKHDAEGWSSTPIPDYMDGYLNSKVLRDFLQKHIEDPDEIAIKYQQKHNIQALLLTKAELQMMYSLIQNFEETKEYMTKTHGISTLLN